MTAIVYKYNEKKRTSSRGLAGIPLRDLTESDVAKLREWELASVESAPYFEKQKKAAVAAGKQKAKKDKKE